MLAVASLTCLAIFGPLETRSPDGGVYRRTVARKPIAVTTAALIRLNRLDLSLPLEIR